MISKCSRFFGGVLVSISFLVMVSAPSAPAQMVRERSEIASLLALEKLTMESGVVSGTVVNRSNHLIRDVQLLVRHTWLWEQEFKPGTDDPGTSTYYTVPGELPPGGRVSFRYSPSPPLPKKPGGHYETTVAIAGFTEVILPAAK